MNRPPSLHIDLLMEEFRQDLLREGVDVALRFWELAGSSAVARKIATNQRVLAASLERAGYPSAPTDLPKHTVIIGPPGNSIDAWRFTRDGKVHSVRVEGRLHASVNEGATAAAVAGLLSTGLRGCRNELANGTLIQILKDWQMDTSDLHAVFPTGRAAKPSARQFVDYLPSEWGDS
jgi:DNA-binding transcriptional LysR family regulator